MYQTDIYEGDSYMTKTPNEDLEMVKELIQLMKDNVIDAIEIGGIKILKTQHVLPETPDQTESSTDPDMDEEELLFYSAK